MQRIVEIIKDKARETPCRTAPSDRVIGWKDGEFFYDRHSRRL